jgi:hypothetical protein
MVTIVLTRVRPIPPRVLSRMLSGSFFPFSGQRGWIWRGVSLSREERERPLEAG